MKKHLEIALVFLCLVAISPSAKANVPSTGKLTGVLEDWTVDTIVVLREGKRYRIPRSLLSKYSTLQKGAVVTANIPWEEFQGLRPMK